MRFYRLAISLVCGTLLGLIAVACGGGGGEDLEEQVRVLHVAPNFSELTVRISSEPSLDLTGLTYASTTGYLEIPEGTVQFRVVDPDKVFPLVDEEQTIASGTDYTYLLYESSDEIATLLQTDTNTDPETGSFSLRVGHFSPDEGAVDIYLTFPDDDISSISATESGVSYHSFSEYIEAVAGTYRIRLTSSGTKNVILDTQSLTFTDRQIRTLLLIEQKGGGEPLQYILLNDKD